MLSHPEIARLFLCHPLNLLCTRMLVIILACMYFRNKGGGNFLTGPEYSILEKMYVTLIQYEHNDSFQQTQDWHVRL
ncbi:hypothetical protein NTGM5_20021 [Candidatus Nitrotoga sp. M5]|nr:hypothetical protein NTGM5_20021 [Candidatus Nitrotoga sp. M5]